MKLYKAEHQIVVDTSKSLGASDTAAAIILAQMMHESTDFTSNVYKKNLNPMGMKVPSKRKDPYIAGRGTQPPGNEGATPYARYNSLADAVRSLFNWLAYNKIAVSAITTPEEYSERLRQRSYFGNTQEGKRIYIAGLKNNLKKIAFVGGPATTAATSAAASITAAVSGGDDKKKR